MHSACKCMDDMPALCDNVQGMDMWLEYRICRCSAHPSNPTIDGTQGQATSVDDINGLARRMPCPFEKKSVRESRAWMKRRTYLSRLQEIDVILPDLKRILILADMTKCKVIALPDDFTCVRTISDSPVLRSVHVAQRSASRLHT